MITINGLNQEDLNTNSLEKMAKEVIDTEINIGQNGDIINRYRIPIENNEVDINLKLPDDSDSSKSSKDGRDESK